MTELNAAVVILTGATGGFGQELTRQLLQAGSRLILSDLDAAALEKQATAIKAEIATGEIIACLAANLATLEGCQALYQKVQAIAVPIDILINNAGIGLFGRMDEVPLEQWERLMQVNLLTPMRLSTFFGADMITRRQGHIVNISSVAGWIGTAGMAHYAASKFGLRGFSEALSAELKPYNVKVTAVYPFFSRTPILQSQRYGTLAETTQDLPDHLITDPARVMQVTLRGIQQNKLHVFPDRTAQILHWLKRYAPQTLDWMSAAFARSTNRGQRQ